MVEDALIERIRQEINQYPVLLYMKGTPIFPQCGFSAVIAGILEDLDVAFESIDVLPDPGLREGIKRFADWPTIPQLYVKGSFVGGADIVREMAASGELQALLRAKGIRVGAST